MLSVLRYWARPVFLGACLSGHADLARSGNSPILHYVGSETCVECHEGEASEWRNSHHAWAWTPPNETRVFGDFGDSVLRHKDGETRFTKNGDAFFVETTGADGALQRYRVIGVAGVAPLQQYLVEIDPGRLQALDFAWDNVRKRWFHLYPSTELSPGDGLHWTGPYKNWNARCAECHATGFEKNYNPGERVYRSRQAEIGVGCEACHGPSKAHLAWVRDGIALPEGLSDQGFTIGFDTASPETEIQQCAGCHSRREPLFDSTPVPGTPYHDAYRLALLREGLYHADGTIEDEVYVYGSFLQSKMYARGVRCSDCHDPHAATLKEEGNALCKRCHSPTGNARFPTLRRAVYDAASHHFHELGSRGAACVSCHMIERVYMQIDGRRDHSFRVPRPDLSAKTGVPNACNDCHFDRDTEWAAEEISRRFPESAPAGPHFSETFAAARLAPRTFADTLIEIAGAGDMPGVIRASAIDLASRGADERTADAAAHLLGDDDALVREAAVGMQRVIGSAQRIGRLAPLLEDPVRSVRIAVARALLDAPLGVLPSDLARSLRAAMGEWRESLIAKSDFPEAQLALGGAALVLRDVRAAEAAFREVVRLDPQRIEGWTMIVRIRAAVGDKDGAVAALNEALAVNKSDATLNELGAQLRQVGP